MSVLLRVVSVVLLLATVAGLGVAILISRRETRVRLKFDIARLVVSAGTLTVLTIIGPPQVAWAVLGGGLVLGLVLGALQGRGLRVRLAPGPTTYVARTLFGLTIWGVGIVVIQAAGLLNLSGLLDLGRGVSALGVGLLAGTVVTRQGRISDARATWRQASAPAAATAAVVMLALGAGLAGSSGLVETQAAAEPQALPSQVPPAVRPTCPASLGGLGLWDALDPGGSHRYNEHETSSGAPYGLGGLDCTYNETPEGTDTRETGDYTITFSWTQGDAFFNCESRDGFVEVNEPGGGNDYFNQVFSGDVNAWASIQGADGTLISYDQAEGLVQDLFQQVASDATPCGTPDPMPPDSQVTCPEMVSDLVRAGIVPGEFEGQHWINCSYTLAYVDERLTGTGGSLSATWFDSLTAAQEGDEAGCGREVDDDGSSIVHWHSADRYAEAGINVDPSSEYRGAFEAEVPGMLSQAEAITPECTEIVGSGVGPPGSGGEGGSDSDEAAAGGSDEADDEIDPADAAALAAAGLAGVALATAIALVESGHSVGDVAQAWSNKGMQGLTNLGQARSTTVYLTGEEAQRVLDAMAAGGPVRVAIPSDQQWEIFASGEAGMVKEGHMGTTGQVTEVGAVARGGGEISISVEVDVDPATADQSDAGFTPAPKPAADAAGSDAPAPDSGRPDTPPPDQSDSGRPDTPPPGDDRFSHDQIDDAVADFLDRPRGPDEWSDPPPG